MQDPETLGVVVIAMVMNCTTGVNKKSGKIDIISAAERNLGLKDETGEKLHGILAGAVSSSQVPALCRALSEFEDYFFVFYYVFQTLEGVEHFSFSLSLFGFLTF